MIGRKGACSLTAEAPGAKPLAPKWNQRCEYTALASSASLAYWFAESSIARARLIVRSS